MSERERAVYRKFDVVVVVTYVKKIIDCRKLWQAYFLEVRVVENLVVSFALNL